MMRILVLCKRQYTSRDLLDDQFGRLYEIPQALATLGHDVQGLTLSYRKRVQGPYVAGPIGNVLWESVNGYPFSPFHSWLYFRRLNSIVQSFRPDLVWSSSDAWHLIVAWMLKKSKSIPFVADLYDNYESFGLSKVPGITILMRQACREAMGLSVVGNELATFVRDNYRINKSPILVLGNGIDAKWFRSIPKTIARRELGLPIDGLLIGTAGSLDHSRGIEVLFEAFTELRSSFPNLQLVIAGPRDDTLKPYKGSAIIDLGIVPTDQIPLVFNALDVAVICNRDTDFGRYCYPQKFQEIVACETPLVAANLGELQHILRDWPDHLYLAESSQSLADRVTQQLLSPKHFPPELVCTWGSRGEDLAMFMEGLIRQ